MADSIETATIAAATAVVCAMISAGMAFFASWRSTKDQRELERLRHSTQLQLEAYKAELASREAEHTARRDYEFEGRKRLYARAAPLLFQFYENALYAINRMRNLARASRSGDLPGWLDEADTYYLHSTLHSFLAPLASIQILREELTMLDLSLDPVTERQYELGKAINRSFNRDVFFAAAAPAVNYVPPAQARDGEAGAPQGVFGGEVHRAVRCMIRKDGERLRTASFAEFSDELRQADSDTARALEAFTRPWIGFQPATRPVFWRILIAQLFLYRAARLYREEALDNDALLQRVRLSEQEQREFAYSDDPACWPDIQAGYEVGLRYLQSALKYRDPFGS
jgi:hypothetical protein